MDHVYLWTGKAVIWTCGSICIALLLSFAVYLAGVACCAIFDMGVKKMRAVEAYSQFRRCHRPFFAWCRNQLESGLPIRDGIGGEVTPRELRDAIRTYDE